MIDRDSGPSVSRREAARLRPVGTGTRWPAPDEALMIRVRREPGCSVVSVAGEIDIATVASLREQLWALAADGRPVVADLDQVGFIDAAGLGVLAGAARRAAAGGGSLHVVCDQRQTLQLFRLTGLDRVIPVARTLGEALHAAGSEQNRAV